LPAYLPELLPRLSQAISETDFIGTNLKFIGQCVELFNKLEKDHSKQVSNELFKKAHRHINKEYEIIQSLLTQKSVEDIALQKQKLKFRVDSVWIPLVELEQFLTAINPVFASLQKLQVDVWFNNKKTEKDKLQIKQLSQSETVKEEDFCDTIEAAKHLLKTFANIKSTKQLIINCSFDKPVFVEGQSLQAGLAAVIFTELLRLYQHKEEYALKDDVAITGRIDKLGNLLPVDESGLKLKVEACYFSHIRYLIVPKEQEALCRTHCSRLTAQCGNSSSSLEVIGISNLEELFYNRKFTDSRRISVAKQTIRKVWNLRRPIAAVVFVVLFLIIGKMLYGPLDKNPVDYSADGEILSLKNKYGEVVDKIFIGNSSVKNINIIIKDGLGNKLVSLLDINGDKINEVIYAQAYQDASDKVSRVFCKDIIKDTILWNVKVERKFKFPHHPYVNSEVFSIGNIGAGDYDNDNRSEIYVSAGHSRYFPGLLIKLDALIGEKLAEYINIGHCSSMEFVDIDSDGVSEVILGGVNNSYDMAAVAILDSRFIEGHSPISKNYDIEEIKPGLEKAYILIPRTIVGNNYRYEYRHNNVQQIQKSDRSINIAISDCPYPTDDKKPAIYYVQLNFDLSVKDIGTGNVYDLLSRQLYAEGKLKQRVDVKYFNEYKKEILYWDGEKFVNYPTFNKKYLEAVAKLKPVR
jgi:hypothetical protein